jgi:hypothetical protein
MVDELLGRLELVNAITAIRFRRPLTWVTRAASAMKEK